MLAANHFLVYIIASYKLDLNTSKFVYCYVSYHIFGVVVMVMRCEGPRQWKPDAVSVDGDFMECCY